MTPAQRETAEALLRSFLSAEGYLKVQSIIARSRPARARRLERARSGALLVRGVRRPGVGRALGRAGRGHHVSLHLAVIKGQFVASTPTFLGANPAEVQSGARKGQRVLAAEEDTARALLESLTPEQRRAAVVDAHPTATSSRATSRRRTRSMPTASRSRAYGAAAEARARDCRVYAGTMKPKLAEERLARIRRAGLDAVRLAWRAPPHAGGRTTTACRGRRS